jgi:hypothetical protein
MATENSRIIARYSTQLTTRKVTDASDIVAWYDQVLAAGRVAATVNNHLASFSAFTSRVSQTWLGLSGASRSAFRYGSSPYHAVVTDDRAVEYPVANDVLVAPSAHSDLRDVTSAQERSAILEIIAGAPSRCPGRANAGPRREPPRFRRSKPHPRRAQLDQLLDDEPVAAEEPHPLAVGNDVFDHSLSLLETPEIGLVEMQNRIEVAHRGVEADGRERAREMDGQEPTRTQDAGDRGERALGLSERHGAVIAKDDVDACGGERERFGRGQDERNGAATLRH